jgi:hypothetical protein
MNFRLVWKSFAISPNLMSSPPINANVASLFDAPNISPRSPAPPASQESRSKLSPIQARDIFHLKNQSSRAHAASVVLARQYQVTSKTVRDIWAGRTWLDVTFNLWDPADRPAMRTRGRPKGSKDKKKRDQRSSSTAVPTASSAKKQEPGFQASAQGISPAFDTNVRRQACPSDRSSQAIVPARKPACPSCLAALRQVPIAREQLPAFKDVLARLASPDRAPVQPEAVEAAERAQRLRIMRMANHAAMLDRESRFLGLLMAISHRRSNSSPTSGFLSIR